MEEKRRVFIAFLVILWMLGIISIYFVYHKPIDIALAVKFTRALIRIFIAIVIVSISGGLGVLFFSTDHLNPLALLSIQAALGMGVLSIMILLLGSLIGVTKLIAWLGVSVLAIVLNQNIRNWWRQWENIRLFWTQLDFLEKNIIAGVIGIFILTLTAALGPPIKFDGLLYHLALPQAYVHADQVVYVDENALWGMPQLAHMLYLLAMTLGDSFSAGIIGWFFGLLSVMGILGFAYKRLNRRTAWVAVASLLSGYSLAASLGWSYVDWPSVLFGLALLITLDLWRTNNEQYLILLAGAITGMAIGVKYTAGLLVFAGLGCMIWELKGNKKVILTMKLILLYSFFTVLLAMPWLIKNVIPTGNPLYPFLYPSGEMNNLRISLYQDQPVYGNWLDLVFLPIRATLFGIEGGIIPGKPGYTSSIGPLLIGLSILVLINWRSYEKEMQRFIVFLSLFNLIFLSLWAIGGRFSGALATTHLYFAIFPGLSVFSSIGFLGLDWLRLPRIRIKRLVTVLILIVLWLNVIQVGVDTFQVGSPQYQLGIINEKEYLTTNLGWYSEAMETLQKLPANSQVLLLWEPRSFYCQPLCDPDEVLDRWLVDRNRWETPSAILRAWQNESYSHVLFYKVGADFVRNSNPQRYRSPDWQALDLLLSDLTLLENFGDAYMLYSLDGS